MKGYRLVKPGFRLRTYDEFCVESFTGPTRWESLNGEFRGQKVKKYKDDDPLNPHPFAYGHYRRKI
jgi:hypothetical protein